MTEQLYESAPGCHRPGDTRVEAQHEETGRFWSGDLKDLPPRYFVFNSEHATEYARRKGLSPSAPVSLSKEGE